MRISDWSSDVCSSDLDTVESSVNYDLRVAGAVGTHVAGGEVENLILTGTALSGTGNDLANKITGNDATNHLDGRGGNDTILGGGGADIIDGGDGDDSLVGGGGSDIIDGEGGSDTLVGGAALGSAR